MSKYIKMNKSFCTIIILFFAIQLQAQDTLSLSDAIQIGLNQNYGIRISGKDLEISENNNTIGNAGMLPTLTIGATNLNRLDNQESQAGGARNDIRTTSLTPYANLRWTLFNGFSVKIRKNTLQQLQNISETALAMNVETTIQEIITSYYKCLLEQQKLHIIEELMVLSKDRYDYMLEKKKLGGAVTFEVLQFQNAFLTDSSNYLLQKLNYENSLRSLSLLLADTVSATYILTEEFSPQIEKYELADLMNKMQASNRTILLKEQNLKILENNLKLQKSSLYPSLSLNSGADYSLSNVRIDGGDANSGYSYDMYANFTLSYTVFNGFNKKRQIQNSKIEHEIGQLEQEELSHQMQNYLLSVYEMYEARKQLYEVANENLEAAQLNLQIAEDKYKSGAINSFNYRDIQINYANIAFSRLQSIYNLIDSHTELMRVTGSIVAPE